MPLNTASKTTELLSPSPAGISRAAQLLQSGDLVSFPTETVYGLGADARQGAAVAAIYAAKGRPSFNPLIAHVASTAAAKRYVVWNGWAEILAQAFWPGPLTLVLPLAPEHGISDLVTAGLDTLALRVPAHPTAQKLLAEFDVPVAAPSANPSGRISPTTAAHVMAGLRAALPLCWTMAPVGLGWNLRLSASPERLPCCCAPAGWPQKR